MAPGFGGLFKRILSVGEGKRLKRLAAVVPYINALEPQMEALSDGELRAKTEEFKKRLADGQTLDDILVEAFAVVREAAKRTLGQRHFDVQLMGGMALHFGWIAEMKTGEGKTLVSTLPAYLNALSGRGVHLVTVNDYLAERDARWMGRVHEFLGLSVGLLHPSITDPALRRAAYEADITYGTNSEFGFDYLRDNMALSPDQLVQRGHVYAIIDEVDSILIDEARTPLIISGPAVGQAELYYRFAAIARSLKRDVDYEVDEAKNTVLPTEEGIAKVERILGIENLYDQVSTNLVHHLIKALEAKELKKRDRDYVVMDGEVKIIDEFTHRILEGRRWEEGLHQAIEAKEGLRIKEENHTLATITLQNYFRMYEKLAGMTGTAQSEASEFAAIYGMAVVPIPTHKPMIRVDYPDVVYKTEDAKFRAVVRDIKEHYERGQPVLVGTASIEKSEKLSSMLKQEGIPHSVLNAKNHYREAEIIAQAGRLGAVTVSTNMAGRGVDILLGGNPEGLALADLKREGLAPDSDEGRRRLEELKADYEVLCKEEGDKVRELGGLYVLGSERHESRRIDDQLRGRAGRQGDPGKSRFYLSFEDELMRLFSNVAVNWLMSKAIPEDVPLEQRMFTRAIERAQKAVEARNSEIRREVLKYDEVLNEQRKAIYARRMEILKGADLRDYTEDAIVNVASRLVEKYCSSAYPEEWDIDGLVAEVRVYTPFEVDEERFRQAGDKQEARNALAGLLLEHYERKEAGYEDAGLAREVERTILLQLIDQHWREHLAEMDYLRQGINLRAMGQQDPLVAWRQEGFAMFERMLMAIEEDYLRYLLRVEVVPRVERRAQAPLTYQGGESARSDLRDEVLVGAGSRAPGRAASGKGHHQSRRGSRSRGSSPGAQASVPDKLGRNDPCWCGSGRKYKHCHGAPV
jgi:preprotein translocase subunit SecA